MRTFLEAIEANVTGDELLGIRLPDRYRAAIIRQEDAGMFEGLDSRSKDPRKSLRVEEVAVPELAPDEVVVAVMASSINYNTVWASIFEPISTFAFLQRYGRESVWTKRHDLPYQVLGTDAAGVVLRVGSLVRNWRPGDRVVVQGNVVDDQDPSAHDDAMLAVNHKAWGFETNFGGLGELTVVKANQLMPKPAHLTWEEAGSTTLCNATAYRMLVARHGARMKQGDSVLVWGAAGGVGGFGVQYVLNGGAVPVAVVSSEEKVEIMRRLGVEAVINRSVQDYRFWNDDDTPNEREWRRLGSDIRALVGGDPQIVFEHVGRETMGASVYACARGGTIVTCAATSGFRIEYDNRHLWMRLKTIKGSHFANYQEAWWANDLVCAGKVHPIMSEVYPLDAVGEATAVVHENRHAGKVAVLCLAPREGDGVTDPALRAEIGEDRLGAWRRDG